MHFHTPVILAPLLLVRDTEDDDVAFQRNSLELSKELQRDKPRKEVILSLTRQTYPVRRASVLSDAADVCVQSLLSEYPELKKPYVVCFLLSGPFDVAISLSQMLYMGPMLGNLLITYPS